MVEKLKAVWRSRTQEAKEMSAIFLQGVDILEGLDASGAILATLEGLWSQKLHDPEDSCMNLSFWMLSFQALLKN